MLFAAILDFATVLMTLLMLFGVLLIIIILLQKGRGGGLAGAFGGAGGQSALGTKAGDVFTKITIVMAVIWVILAGISGITTRASSGKYSGGTEAVSKEPSIEALDTDKKPDATDGENAGLRPAAEVNKEAPADPKTAPVTEKKEAPAKPAASTAPAEKKQETPAKPEATKSETKPK